MVRYQEATDADEIRENKDGLNVKAESVQQSHIWRFNVN